MGLDRRKPVFMGFANNKCADQPAQMHSLMSAFVICLLESMLSIWTCRKHNCNFVASLSTWARWFESLFVQNPRQVFSRCGLNMIHDIHKSATIAHFVFIFMSRFPAFIMYKLVSWHVRTAMNQICLCIHTVRSVFVFHLKKRWTLLPQGSYRQVCVKFKVF